MPSKVAPAEIEDEENKVNDDFDVETDGAGKPKRKGSLESAIDGKKGKAASEPKAPKPRSAAVVLIFQNLISILTVAAVILSIITGVILRMMITDTFFWTQRRSSYVGFVGELFVNMLQCMVIPLITTTMIAAIGAIEVKSAKIIAARGIALILLTSTIAILIGVFLASIIQPGGRGKEARDVCLDASRSAGGEGRSASNDFSGMSHSRTPYSHDNPMIEFGQSMHTDFSHSFASSNKHKSPSSGTRQLRQLNPQVSASCKVSTKTNQHCKLNKDTILDMIRSFFPPNIVEASIEQIKTVPDFAAPNSAGITQYTGCEDYLTAGALFEIEDYGLTRDNVRGTNILGLIVFSVALGIAALHAGDIGLPLMNFFISFSEVTLKMTHWIIWVSPLGVFSLVLNMILQSEDLGWLAMANVLFTITVLVGLVIHTVLVLPLLYFLFTRSSPVKLISSSKPALSLAFACSSSSATLPMTLKILDEKIKIAPRVTNFIGPLGSTINLDGVGLYQIVTVLFIAQLHRMELNVGEHILLCLMSLVGSIGASGIPSGGLFTTTLVLNSVGLPADLIGHILIVDWFIDRFLTVTNVLSDIVVATTVHKCSIEKLARMDMEEAEAAGRLATLELGEDDHMDMTGGVHTDMGGIHHASDNTAPKAPPNE